MAEVGNGAAVALVSDTVISPCAMTVSTENSNTKINQIRFIFIMLVLLSDLIFRNQILNV